MMQNGWTVKSLRFRFQLGEKQFYARNFKVAVDNRRFLEITGHPDRIELPTAELGGKVAAYAVFSHPISEPLPMLTMLPGVIRYAAHQYRRGYVRVEGKFDQYVKGLSSNNRNQIKRKVKKFREKSGGEIRFFEYADEAALQTFHPLARGVSVRTYQEKLLKKGLPDTAEFVAEMAERGRSRPSRARGYLLFDGERAIAYLYAEINGETMAFDYVGYDPEYADWSPGNVLQYLILERIFNDATCRIFDFGEGEAQYKDFFATDTVECADVYFFPRDLRGYALIGSQVGLLYLSRGIKQALDRLGLREQVKRLLRGRPAAVKSGPRP